MHRVYNISLSCSHVARNLRSCRVLSHSKGCYMLLTEGSGHCIHSIVIALQRAGSLILPGTAYKYGDYRHVGHMHRDYVHGDYMHGDYMCGDYKHGYYMSQA